MLIKMNSEDFVPGGLTVDDMLESAELVAAAGVDAIELSGGTSLSGDLGPIRTRAASRGSRGLLRGRLTKAQAEGECSGRAGGRHPDF